MVLVSFVQGMGKLNNSIVLRLWGAVPKAEPLLVSWG